VQRDVEDQGADHPALRGSLLGWGEPVLADHARLQPSGHGVPGGEAVQLVKDVIVVSVVERRFQVRVQRPPTLGAGACHGPEDRGDGILAAAARPEAVGTWFELGFPLRLQRIHRQGL